MRTTVGLLVMEWLVWCSVFFQRINDLRTALKLQELGIPIGVLSNKSHDFTLKCVDAFLSNWQWTVVLGARDGIPKKPDPHGAIEAAEKMGVPPEQCYFIDSDVDILTASNAKMQAIGVEWGFRSVEELKESGAQAVLSTPQELLLMMDL